MARDIGAGSFKEIQDGLETYNNSLELLSLQRDEFGYNEKIAETVAHEGVGILNPIKKLRAIGILGTVGKKLDNAIPDSNGVPDGRGSGPDKTPTGADSIATKPKLTDQLRQENLDNIAKSDPRLARAIDGSGTSNPNLGIGTASASKADDLGRIWVGDGAVPVKNQASCPGCLKSADGTRIYRPPTAKPNTGIEFNPTGVQANFILMDEAGKIISNAHLVIE